MKKFTDIEDMDVDKGMDRILIRFGELALKSTPVRIRFQNKLISNISSELKKQGLNYKIEKSLGRIYILTNQIKEVSRVLEKSFGVVSFSPVITMKTDFNKMCERVKGFAVKNIKKGETFAIRVRRAGSHNFTSKMAERKIGSMVLEKVDAKVDLNNPDKTVYVEARQKKTFIFKDRVKGPGGLPLGVEGKVVALFTGDLNSTLAAWLMMKRGCYVLPVYADNKPYTDERNDERVKEVAKELDNWAQGSRFEPKTFDNGKNFFLFYEEKRDIAHILCKRMLFRVAEKIAKKHKAKAIVTGESLAHQSLNTLRLVDESTTLPVFRPLVGWDKKEIQDFAKYLGFFEKSKKEVKNYPLPKSRRMARSEELEDIEKKLETDKLLEEAVKTIN